jgi:aminoglycoside phosphotransferase (APT) family kinase protein
MKRHWQRGADFLDLDIASLTALVQPAFPGQEVTEAVPARGGLSNTNYRLTVSGRQSPLRLRIFRTRPQSSRLEAALAARVQPRVPVPRFLYHADSNPFTGHPYAILEWLEGIALDDMPEMASTHEVAGVGWLVGKVLADIGSFKFTAAGFLNEALAVEEPMQLNGEFFRSYIHWHISGGLARERLGEELSGQLWRFVTRASPLFDHLDHSPCLVHGDFDGSNILVNKLGGHWQVSGVVDWEYAISATPLVDLGHILRPPFGDIEPFERSVIEGFTSHGGTLGPNWKRACRLLDLINWVSFMNRTHPGQAVIESSREMILRTMQSW